MGPIEAPELNADARFVTWSAGGTISQRVPLYTSLQFLIPSSLKIHDLTALLHGLEGSLQALDGGQPNRADPIGLYHSHAKVGPHLFTSALLVV